MPFLIRALLVCCCCWLGCGPLQAQTPDPLPPLPPLDSLPADQLASIASQLFIRAKAIEGQRAEAFRTAQTERNSQEQNLKMAKQDTSISKSVLDSLATHLKTARNAERSASAELKKAQRAASFCEKTAVLQTADQRAQLPKAWKQLNALLSTEQPAADPAPDAASSKLPKLRLKKPKDEAPAEAPAPALADTPAPPDSAAAAQDTKPRSKKAEPPAQPKYATYDPAQDVMLHPPTPPCLLAVESRDEFTGATLRQTQPHDLFRFTTPALRSYLEGKDQIVCQAAISTAGTNANLLLIFLINDPNGRRAFGSLPKNGLAVLSFTDGNLINISNVRTDEGSTDPDTKTVTYRAQYPLDAATLRKMRSTELDRLRIHWSTGYEEYDVQQVDALMHQVPCASGQ